MKTTDCSGTYPYTVIVNWNLKNDTIECIDSLLAAGLPSDKIILVDNGSTDGSVEAIKLRYKNDLHLIENPQNDGFAAGCNQGMRKAVGLNADWVFILNNDTIVEADIFTHLCQARDAYPQYAILGPIIFYAAEPERIWFLGHRLFPGTLLTRDIYNQFPRPNALPKILPVDFLNGCAMLIRKEVLIEVGYFDPRLVMYGEEVDLCWRARLSGFRCATVTSAHMWHKVSRSARNAAKRTKYLRTRNQIWFYKKYASQFQFPFMFFYSIAKTINLIILDIKDFHPEVIVPQINGWIDGWFSS